MRGKIMTKNKHRNFNGEISDGLTKNVCNAKKKEIFIYCR